MENQTASCIDLAEESSFDATHVEVLAARFSHEWKLADASWRWLLGAAHLYGYKHLIAQGCDRGEALSELHKMTRCKIIAGEGSGHSQDYLSEIGITIDGANANRALQNTIRIAVGIGADFELGVRFPSGREAVLWWSPEASGRRLDELLGLTPL